MRVVSVAARLSDLGYNIVLWEEPGSEPEETRVTFADVVPGFRGKPYASWRLYRHQVEAIEALRRGENIVLTARTGSGKTEAWALAALREGWRVLAVYPTLALAADQIHRLEEYYEAAGYGADAVLRLDRPTLSRMRDAGELYRRLGRAKVVVTNPAFLMAELKRSAERRSVLEHFLASVDLVVLDELDFYGPRGAHLLLAMLEIISRVLAREPPRIAVLTATLGNPGELAAHLERLTGRRGRVIPGRPRHPPNRYILVVGKGIDALYNFVKRHLPVIAARLPWIREVLEDEEAFADRAWEIVEALEAIGMRPPRPALDPVEVLSAILELPEDGVTLVFARSIRHAERLYRGLLARNEAYRRLVGVHHHLVPKQRREELERAAREGRIRMIISVRTLAQGIDIGTVVRVVHVGLPTDLREFQQREGRKGRRREIPFTESVLIPQGLWDSKLLRAGAEAVREWASMKLEKLYINPENAYMRLFTGLWRLIRRERLEPEEEELLRRLGLYTVKDTLMGPVPWPSEKGLRVWRNLGFYEYGPPYGFKRYVRRGGREERVPEEASLRETVERLQPGCYDYTTGALVVELDAAKLRIVEEPVEEATERYEWLRRARGEYEDVKSIWRERPDLERDLAYGRVATQVVMQVEAPTAGFGVLLELPIGVNWVVESRRPRLTRTGRVYHEVHVIELDAPTSGKYSDFTYGYVFEAPGDTDPFELEAGLAYLQVFLRMSDEYLLPLGMLRYSVSPAGLVKRVHVWEAEPAGVIEKIDWGRVADEVSRFKPTPLALTLLAAIDPGVYTAIVQNEKLIDMLPAYASRVARLLAGTRVLRLHNIRVECPRPSPQHRVAAIAVLHERVDIGRTVIVDVIAYHDGSGVKTEVMVYEPGLTSGYEASAKLYAVLSRLFGSGYRVYHYGQEKIISNLLAAGYMAHLVLEQAKREGKLVDLAARLRERLGFQPPLTALGGLGREARAIGEASTRLREALQEARRRGDASRVAELLRRMGEAYAELLYCLALALEKGRIVVEERRERRDNR